MYKVRSQGMIGRDNSTADDLSITLQGLLCYENTTCDYAFAAPSILTSIW